MLYALFLMIAILYNWRKFGKERHAFLTSLVEAKNTSHREMILSHHFYIFIFEGFLALLVAHLITERAVAVGILGLGLVYLGLLFLGFFLFQFFIKHVEKHTQLALWDTFKNHLVKELRVSFAVIMLPILVFSMINWTFQDGVYEEWGSLWFIGLLFNILFVSVLTVACSVIIMLRLIPNREIKEPEYLEVINRRLEQIGMPELRVRWIETDIKNAFVVGLKLLKFSNQTMFIGRSLRTTLTMEEFDAVISHELSHVANRHIQKRLINFLKNFISIIIGASLLIVGILGISVLYWGEDSYFHSPSTTIWCIAASVGWFIFNYFLLFDTIRSHEFEADGYAVMELGSDFDALRSALEKLTTPDEMPEYLKLRTPVQSKKNLISKYFTTHPDLTTRVQFLKFKIDNGLRYDYYVSPAQKLGRYLGHSLQWKFLIPMGVSFILSLVWLTSSYREGLRTIAFIKEAAPEQIMADPSLPQKLNSRPLFIDQSLMAYIVKKEDQRLIDHFLSRGADKGKTLVYVSQLQNLSLLETYYTQFQHELSDDEYFMILRKTAQLNFTVGYRFLVNSKRFEDLNPVYKEDVSRIHKSNRAPASEVIVK
ncbi:MAG TPA: M48 family metallopeptidase [Bacteriovoracaceae bacterium]|nr:M48 family metallopeptidase [Bacteriovoracaceae bacterium]